MTCGVYGRNARLFKDGEIIEKPKDFKSVNKYRKYPEYGHQVAWAEACKAGFGSEEHKSLTSSFDYAGPLNETVLMGNLAIRSWSLAKSGDRGRLNYYGRKKMLWDGQNMKITNFEDANQFVSREYRKGWEIG